MLTNNAIATKFSAPLEREKERKLRKEREREKNREERPWIDTSACCFCGAMWLSNPGFTN